MSQFHIKLKIYPMSQPSQVWIFVQDTKKVCPRDTFTQMFLALFIKGKYGKQTQMSIHRKIENSM